jgi:hypothetical protein
MTVLILAVYYRATFSNTVQSCITNLALFSLRMATTQAKAQASLVATQNKLPTKYNKLQEKHLNITTHRNITAISSEDVGK